MPETRRLVWSPKADDDLRGIWQYFAHVASPEIANKILREIKLRGHRVAERPFLLGRARDEIRPGLRSVLVHPHIIFYRVTDTAVEVARVLHQRQNLPAILANDEC